MRAARAEAASGEMRTDGAGRARVQRPGDPAALLALPSLAPAFSAPACLRGSLDDSAGPTWTFLLKTSRE